MKFAELKAAAVASQSAAELYKIATESNAKYLKNVRTAQLMSFTPGRAAEADHYFQNVLPGWKAINEEILALLRKAMEGKNAEEIAYIIEESEAW
jgi:hypothetical protein